MLLRSQLVLFPSLLLFVTGSLVTAQEVAVPETGLEKEVVLESPPEVWRGEMKNVLTDPMARLPFASSITLRAPIAVHFASKKAAYCWDASTCRLVAVWKGDFLKVDPATNISEPAGTVSYLAEGPAPFSAAVGAYGKPRYFGFKLTDGIPTFYYSVGRLGVQETITFSEDGAVMEQLFKIENAPGEVVLVLPETWKERIASKKGTLKGRFVTFTNGQAAEFSLNYSLADPEAEPAGSGKNEGEAKPDEN